MEDFINKLKGQLGEFSKRTYDAGLVGGAAGNLSIKGEHETGEFVLISARGAQLDRLDEGGIALCNISGGTFKEAETGAVKPSSELPMHLAIYNARKDVKAIIHTHSTSATAVAACGKGIPAFLDEMTYVIGGAVNCTGYAFPGTDEIAEKAVEALGLKQAVLLANHGVIAVGETMAEAFKVACLVEEVAKVYIRALSIGGPCPIPEDALLKQEQVFRRKKGIPDGKDI